jgi:hypothetical protein
VHICSNLPVCQLPWLTYFARIEGEVAGTCRYGNFTIISGGSSKRRIMAGSVALDQEVCRKDAAAATKAKRRKGMCVQDDASMIVQQFRTCANFRISTLHTHTISDGDVCFHPFSSHFYIILLPILREVQLIANHWKTVVAWHSVYSTRVSVHVILPTSTRKVTKKAHSKTSAQLNIYVYARFTRFSADIAWLLHPPLALTQTYPLATRQLQGFDNMVINHGSDTQNNVAIRL